MSDPSQRRAGRFGSVRRRALALGLAGVLASAAVLAGGAVWASRQLDELQRLNETKIVAHTVRERLAMLEKNAHDYAWSDDAALRANLVLDWASAQIGAMLWSSWGCNYVFAVTEDGATIYGLVDGQESYVDAAELLGPELTGLMARARVVDGEPQAVSTVLAVGDQPIAVATAPIEWRTPTVKPRDLPNVHLVLGRRLDQRLLDELRGHLEIQAPHLRPASGTDAGRRDGEWALSGPAGRPVAYVGWEPARPGALTLRALAPYMAAAIAVLLVSAAAAGGVLVRADRRRRLSESRFQDFAHAVSDWLWETDAAGGFTFVSGRFAELAELDAADLLGRTYGELGCPRGAAPSGWAQLQDEMARHQPIREFRFDHLARSGRRRQFRISGRPFFDERGKFLGHRGTGSDVTEEVAAAARMAFLAQHDVLTELPNRALLDERLRQDLANTGGDDLLAVVCVDLDRFKEVNDLHGHAAGDTVLREVAGRLREALRARDTAARLGGDEFVVVLPGVGTPEVALRVAERLVGRLAAPYADGLFDVAVGASAGVALYPTDGDTADRLLRCADMALYQAKLEGRGRARLFAPAMDGRLKQRRQLEAEVKLALARGDEFVLHFQPAFALGARRLVGFEGLIRWRHPKRGMVPPGDFIPLAEETGLIVPLGAWVLRQACSDASRWPGNLTVAVNLSAAQFRQRDLVAQVAAALADSGLDPARLELEITESVLLQDTEGVLRVLAQLKAMGVRVAMDDFGTGFSSLNYLRRFSFDKIKIDRTFVDEVDERPDARAIIEAALGLGRTLGMATVAEGVENAVQLARLMRMGCGEVQGFLCGRPLAATAIEAALRDPGVALSMDGWMDLTARAGEGAARRNRLAAAATDRRVAADQSPRRTRVR